MEILEVCVTHAVELTTFLKNPFIGKLLAFRDVPLVHTRTHNNLALVTFSHPGPDSTWTGPDPLWHVENIVSPYKNRRTREQYSRSGSR